MKFSSTEIPLNHIVQWFPIQCEKYSSSLQSIFSQPLIYSPIVSFCRDQRSWLSGCWSCHSCVCSSSLLCSWRKWTHPFELFSAYTCHQMSNRRNSHSSHSRPSQLMCSNSQKWNPPTTTLVQLISRNLHSSHCTSSESAQISSDNIRRNDKISYNWIPLFSLELSQIGSSLHNGHLTTKYHHSKDEEI